MVAFPQRVNLTDVTTDHFNWPDRPIETDFSHGTSYSRDPAWDVQLAIERSTFDHHPLFGEPSVERVLYRTAVQQTARMLDEATPGWAAKIHPAVLNLHSPYDCVLGQVYARMVQPWSFLSGYHFGCLDLSRRGFKYQAGVFSDDTAYREHWLAEITARQAVAA